MSAWLSPTWGRAAEMFSTLTAITVLPLTLPPVSGFAGWASGRARGRRRRGCRRRHWRELPGVGSVAGRGVVAAAGHRQRPAPASTTAVTAADHRVRALPHKGTHDVVEPGVVDARGRRQPAPGRP